MKNLKSQNELLTKVRSSLSMTAGVLTGLLCLAYNVCAYELDAGSLVLVGADPGEQHIYLWDHVSNSLQEVHYTQSPLLRREAVHNLVIAAGGRQFYSNYNQFSILTANNAHEEESLFFKNDTYVRHLVLDGDNSLYFSTSTGTGGDGHIFKIHGGWDGVPASADPFYTVQLRELADVGGMSYWGGPFAFGRNAAGGIDTNTLYIASGTSVPACIYRTRRENGEWSKIERVYFTEKPINALLPTGPNDTYFVSESKVYRLTNWGSEQEVLSIPGVRRLSGMAVVPAQ